MNAPAGESPTSAAPAAAIAQAPGALAGVLGVASLAFRESARNRVLHALVGALLLAAGSSYLFSWVSGGDADVERGGKIVADLSLSAIVLLGTIASIFLGTNLIYQEIERRTLYSVLARPLSRAGFVVGKYLGLAAVMGVAVGAMGAGFLLIYALGGHSPSWSLVLALLFIYVELLVVLAVAVFFSVAAHPIEGAVFAFVVALAGHVTESLNDLGRELVRQSDGGTASAFELGLQKLLYAVYVLFPNLENFNLRGDAVWGAPPEPERLVWALGYAGLYVLILLVLSSWVFRRRVL